MCIERAVEAVVTDIAPADDRDHIAALGRGDDHSTFERLGAALVLPIEPRQLALERALGLILRAWLEARVDAQPRFGQVLIAIVAAQRPAYEIEVCGVIGARGSRGDSERPTRGRGGIGRLDDALLGHLLQDEIAAGECTLRMASWIVVGGPAHDGDQQRHLRQVELGQGFAEVELAGEAKTVNGAVAVLPEEDLVDVGVHEIGLGEMRVQRHRHDRLAELPR